MPALGKLNCHAMSDVINLGKKNFERQLEALHAKAANNLC